MKRLIACLLGLLLVGLFVASPASAHTTGFSGTATCQKDGTYSIEYTGHTDNVPSGDLATVTETAPDNAVITTTLAPNADYSFTATAPGSATTQHASVHIDWRPGPNGGDTFSADASTDVTLTGDCTAPAPPTSSTPAPPTSSTPAPPTSSTPAPPTSSTPVKPPTSSTPSSPHTSTSHSSSSSHSIAPPASAHKLPPNKPAAHNGPLASTGSQTATLLTIALSLLAVGALAMWFGRKKYVATHAH